MTTLAKDNPRSFALGCEEQYAMIAADIIYDGAAVGLDGSGYARPLVAGDKFVGFARDNVDNTLGAAGDRSIKVRRLGGVVLVIAALAITDVGKSVYASDDNTFTLTATSNSRVGIVSKWLETGVGVVEFAANAIGSSVSVTALTDSSGGSGSDTLAAMTAVGPLVDSNSGGTADGTVSNVADIAITTSGGNTYADSAVNTAVNTALATTRNNFKELQASLTAQIALNLTTKNAVASLAEKVNAIIAAM